MGIREDVSYAGGIAGAAAFGALGWFLNSPLLGVVAGVLLGTGLTLLTQSRTQKRIWKRELGLKNIDTIYGPLYREITRNLGKGSPNARTSFQSLEDAEWQRIKADYLHDFLPKDSKPQLDRYYGLVSKYDSLLGSVLTQVDRTILDQAHRVYNPIVQAIQYGALVAITNNELGLGISAAVLFKEHPRDLLKFMYRDLTLAEFEVVVIWDDVAHGSRAHRLRGPDELKKFDEYFETVCTLVEKLESVREIRQTLTETVSAGKTLQAWTLKLIRDPWSM